VDDLGIIGQVTRAYPFSSEVTLITDKDLAVPVQVERNSLRAIAFGLGESGALELPYLPVNVDIREGDMLVTSGIDGVYPVGLAVAKVKRVERNVDSPFAHIVCTPIGGTEQHRQVLILAAQDAGAPANEPEIGDNTSYQKKRLSRHAPRKP
jgi:rod shape-determining protein MreC